MPVAPQQDLDPGPVGSDAPDHMPQHIGGFFARGAFAGTQERGDRLLGSGLEDQDRLEAGVARMSGEQRKLLAPMDTVDRIIDIEDDLRA